VHLQVRVGSEHYALAIEDVLEVDELGEVTPVPGAPRTVLGIRNLRGLVLPVLDLAELLGAPEARPASGLVVTERDRRRVGLGVTELGDVQALPAVAEESQSPYLQGITWLDGTLVGVVDLEAVLAAVSTQEHAG
jgi:chemotaxis signal transduction protein